MLHCHLSTQGRHRLQFWCVYHLDNPVDHIPGIPRSRDPRGTGEITHADPEPQQAVGRPLYPFVAGLMLRISYLVVILLGLI